VSTFVKLIQKKLWPLFPDTVSTTYNHQINTQEYMYVLWNAVSVPLLQFVLLLRY